MATAAACLVGCNGPKDTCEGSANSFYGTLRGHDWDTMHRMLTPEFKHKFAKVDRFTYAMENIWLGSKSFSVKWNTVSETRERVCIANGLLSYTVKIRGQESKDTKDEYFSWTFRKGNDGLWYAELPGQERIGGY
jgi:hypothetical protein